MRLRSRQSAATPLRALVEQVGFDYAERKTERVRSCNLCGSTKSVAVTQRDRYGFPATMRMCIRCGLGFLSPRMTRSEYSAFYASVYRPLTNAFRGKEFDAQRLQRSQRQYAEKVAGFLASALPRAPRSILDVGGSTGVAAAAVGARFGAPATVLDPSPDELQTAAAAGLETISSLAEDFEPRGRRWDLVMLCQAIDHLLDVTATLESLRRVVAPGGHAFVDFQDVMHVARRRKSVEAAVKIDHPYYLTHETMRGFFDRVGFEPVAELDGRRFVLAPTTPREPDWHALRIAAEANLRELRELHERAGA